VALDGRAARNARLAGGSVIIGPRARIGGSLRYRGGALLRTHAAAEVRGAVEQLERSQRHPARRMPVFGGLWVLGLMLFAALAAWLTTALTARVADAARQRFGWSLLAGFIYVAAGIALGEAVRRRWLADSKHAGWRVLVIGAAALVPWLGKLVALLALVVGMAPC
jgi:hypothetical protein